MEQKLIYSFGRRIGRRLHPHAKQLVRELLPMIQIRAEEGFTPPSDRPVHMEVGFGAGEHLAAMARAHPDILYIGCEPYINGVAKLLAEIEAFKLDNIRLFTDDARLLCQQLPDGCIEKLYLLFPDPWPKTRHHKRRLVSQETLALWARIQPRGGLLQLATDHEDYANWMRQHLQRCEHYAMQPTDCHTPPAEWTQTRYERKTSAQGRAPMFFAARRV